MKKLLEKKPQIKSHDRTDQFCDDEYGCYNEDYFLEMLVLERKRSERSGNPFLVLMLDFTLISLTERHDSIVRVVDALAVLIRETDIKGWYRYGDVVGVIFTEMNSFDTDSFQDKINEGINACLSSQQLETLRLSFHRFPEQGRPNKAESPQKFTFYPDFPEKERAKKIAIYFKRIVDIIGSSLGILIFSPFFILIPVCIKLTSRGPVLFRQERVGQNRRTFTFLKFRSMYINNDENVHKEFVRKLIAKKMTGEGDEKNAGQKVFKIQNDSRVTTVGKILRKTSLDELPQFINVLRGEMSLVGPRPPIPYELEKYAIWHLRRVLEVKPGISGLWQVEGRSSTSFDEMVRLDLQYATNWSVWLDIKLMLKTPWVMVAGKGAY